MTFTELPFVYFVLVVYGLWLLCRRSYRAKLLLLLGSSLFSAQQREPRADTHRLNVSARIIEIWSNLCATRGQL